MKDYLRRLFAFAFAMLCAVGAATDTAPARGAGAYAYAFQDPDAPVERRIDALLAAMTLDEKVGCLGTDPSVPRLGVKGAGHMEGIHGLAAGGPAKWGGKVTTPTTTF